MSEERLNSLLLAWQDYQERGHDVPADELCRDCPELAATLARRIQVLREMKQMMEISSSSQETQLHGAANPNSPSTSSLDTESLESGRPAHAAISNSVPGYDILEELGRGGMGVVYKARQKSLNRIVALKMILAGSHASPEAAERFLREAETIARLKHPNIVQVHEYGTHQEKPYFSLEYLEGGSLAARLKGEPQAPTEAARLVETLAHAVEAAHALGIVHRDLKPANLLIGADLVVKITDFGLAKQGDSAVTATGEVLGTPSYMAPEQAEGNNRTVGPPADIYALGAILYELLTGRPPFKGATSLDTILMVVDSQPVAPSRLQPKVPRDLETICLKCLEKESAKRYATASELAADLERFLRGQPVLARPVGQAERLWRWCRRNPVVAGLSAALLFALLVGLGSVIALWLDAEKQRTMAIAAEGRALGLAAEAQEAQKFAEQQSALAKAEAAKANREANTANRTATFLIEMFQSADPLGIGGIPALKTRTGEELTARQILDRGAEKVARELAGEPETQIKLLNTMGKVYCTLGFTDKAQSLLEKALALGPTLPKDDPEVAATLHNLGWVHHQAGDYTAARRLYEDALGVRQKHADADPFALSETRFNLGWLLADLEDFVGAEQMFKSAVELRLRCRGPDHRDVAVARLGLAASYLAQQQVTSAIPPYQQAMAALRKAKDNEGLVESIDQFQKGVIGRQLPALLRGPLLGLKDDQAVEDCLKRALTLGKDALGGQHHYVSLILHELAVTLARHHKDEEAERYFRECLHNVRGDRDAAHQGHGLDHPKATFLLDNFSWLLKRRGKQAEAEQLLDEALQVRRHRYPGGHRLVADVLVIQAGMLDKTDSSGRRRKLLREALTIYCRTLDPASRYLPACVNRLAESLSGSETCDLACELTRAAARRSESSHDREIYRDLAMRVLRQAQKKGFNDLVRLQQDHDLDNVRGREDFVQLIVELRTTARR
jgi:serine/threonine protein kinase/Tfp pilus assembly protein PilF